MRELPTEAEPIRTEVQQFLAKTGMAPSTFGRQALNNGNFVAELLRGRKPRSRTVERIAAFMDDAEKNQQRRDAAALAEIQRGDGYVQCDALGEPIGLPAGVPADAFRRLVGSGQLVGGGDALLDGQHQTYRPA